MVQDGLLPLIQIQVTQQLVTPLFLFQESGHFAPVLRID
jgi:hypothetical protein